MWQKIETVILLYNRKVVTIPNELFILNDPPVYWQLQTEHIRGHLWHTLSFMVMVITRLSLFAPGTQCSVALLSASKSWQETQSKISYQLRHMYSIEVWYSNQIHVLPLGRWLWILSLPTYNASVGESYHIKQTEAYQRSSQMITIRFKIVITKYYPDFALSYAAFQHSIDIT